MSTKILISTAAIGLLFFGSASANGQRNLLEGIIGGAINEAINGNNQRRTPPSVTTPSNPGGGQQKYQSAMPAEAGRSPNESGRENYTNPFGGAWRVIRQPPVQQPTRPPQTIVRPPPNYVQRQPTYVRPSAQPPQYYQQQPQYQTYPQTVYPQGSTIPQGSVIQQGTTPTYATPTVKTAPAAVDSIRITLPRTQAEACSFTLVNGTREYPRSLSPGQMQKLKGAPNTWNVRFNSPAGTKTYRLRDNTNYVFQSQGSGLWQLYKQPKVVLEEPPELPQ